MPPSPPQSELVKMAMVNQHKQELEVVRASGREKVAAMQTELVKTLEMLEKMHTGWQNSLEDALTEMRINSEVKIDNLAVLASLSLNSLSFPPFSSFLIFMRSLKCSNQSAKLKD